MRLLTAIFISVFAHGLTAQDHSGRAVPAVHSNIHYSDQGDLYLTFDGRRVDTWRHANPPRLLQMRGDIRGTETGLAFDFGSDFSGALHFGFVPYGDSRHPMPVYFYNPQKIHDGKAAIQIKEWLDGKFDMIGWQEKGYGTVGYRVIDEWGKMMYDGKVSFAGAGPFEVDTTIIEGPFVNLLSHSGATISFGTNFPTRASIAVGQHVFAGPAAAVRHEIAVSGLRPDSVYSYVVRYGGPELKFSFRTAPEPGSRKPFVFSYCSDSRSGMGGGERNLHGANFYIMKKIMALNTQMGVRFCQFTGDLIDGYLTDAGQMHLQYANWKRAVEPFAHYFPIVAGMGNHEAFNYIFLQKETGLRAKVNRFPFQTASSEVLFAENFVNPLNGPESEDGSGYDPNPEQVDFPPYSENVFYYTYDNVAMVVLNSDYFYAPTVTTIPLTSGNPHGYIMDNQLAWFADTIEALEADPNIDHIFVTLHTPMFPNGGHVGDDMWYHGNNDIRPYIAGEPVAKGIIERRDELLDIMVNYSRKCVAVLTGDEHNYNRLRLTDKTEIYPPDWEGARLHLSRPFYQINNGAAGAPYYAQEPTPWSEHVRGFTTQNALVFFHINGDEVAVEVRNPDTLEEVDRFVLR